jgi:hypothetical protein
MLYTIKWRLLIVFSNIVISPTIIGLYFVHNNE